MRVIVETISKYLSSHRRLTVAQLGTFITRGEGEAIIFSEFIKADDGVLHSLLVEQGISDLDAATLIEGFVESVRREAEFRGGECDVEGLCRVKLSAEDRTAQSFNSVIDQLIVPSTPTISTMQSSTSTPSQESEPNTIAEESDTKPQGRRRVDLLSIFIFVMILAAVLIFASSFVMAWQSGAVELPESLDAIMESLFGGDLSAMFDLSKLGFSPSEVPKE